VSNAEAGVVTAIIAMTRKTVNDIEPIPISG